MSERIVELEAQPTAAIRIQQGMHELDIGGLFGRYLPVIFGRVTELGEPSGPPYGRYYTFGPDHVDMEIGVPVSTPLPGLALLEQCQTGAERVAGQRRYRAEVLHRLSIVDVAQRAGLTLDEIAPLTGPDNRSAEASRHIRALAGEKLPHIDALIARAQAVRHWLEVAQSCDCESVDVCGLFADPALLPPAADVRLDVRQVRPAP